MRLFLCVVVVASAIIFFAPDDSGVSAAVQRNVISVSQSSQATQSQLSATSSLVMAPSLAQRLEDPDSSILFPVMSWQPATLNNVNAVVTAPVAATPTAPPLPFRLVGQLKQAEGTLYVLEHGGRTSMVSVGESIDGQYLLERVEPGALLFRYLPLQEMQSLPLAVPQ